MARLQKVLFIVPYPLNEAPSQRFRFEQYFAALQTNSIEFDVESYLSSRNSKVFYKPGHTVTKLVALASGFVRRIVVMIGVSRYDLVFIHREAAPIGPPIFEWIIAKIFRRRIIYDFDDAIWLTDLSGEAALSRILKYRRKVSTICRLSYKVSCGNAYLADYARGFNQSVVVNPTTIDTNGVHDKGLVYPSIDPPAELIIGWTGSHSTLKYLQFIEPVLQRIERNYPNVSFMVIADKPPVLQIDRFTFLPWRAATEIADLSKIDIGIMPLPDDEWSKGKCGFKILQYMALEIPSVSSAVGTNKEIVCDGENGFLCSSHEEWYNRLQMLIDDPLLRKRLGSSGRATVEQRYSLNSNTANFLALFK